jgi:hypothetical protein
MGAMKTFERIPSVCMDPKAHFDGNVWKRGFTIRLRLLTDKRIAHYERQGRYRELWQPSGNRLVYNA